MKRRVDETILGIIVARRKTGKHKTPFALGVGYISDGDDNPTGKVLLRSEQIKTGTAHFVGTLCVADALRLRDALTHSITVIRQNVKDEDYE